MLAPIIPTIKKAKIFCLGLAKPKSLKTKTIKSTLKIKQPLHPLHFASQLIGNIPRSKAYHKAFFNRFYHIIID